MKINVPFRRKDTEIETSPCVVEKTVELSAEWFEHFSENLMNDYDFIIENSDCMYQDRNGVSHCLLVLGEGRDDGILVESEGSSYARYSAFVPNARQLAILDQHPSVSAFLNEMKRLTDQYVQKALAGQTDCQYRIRLDEVQSLCRHNGFHADLFMDMLSERPEIEYAEPLENDCLVCIAQPYLKQGKEYQQPTEEQDWSEPSDPVLSI